MAVELTLEAAVQGARHSAQTVTWAGQNLTGATLTGTKTNLRTGDVSALDGVLTTVTPLGGIFTWAYGAGDVGQADDFLVQFKATYAADSKFDANIASEWTVEPLAEATVVPSGILIGVTPDERAWLDLLSISSPTDGQVLTYDSGTGTWRNETLPAGAVTFLELTDTPNSFVDQAMRLLRVNSAQDAIEFFDSPFALDNDLESHVANTSNPHGVTAAQAGALAIANNLSDVGNAATARTNIGAASAAALAAHLADTANPHATTAGQVGAQPTDATLTALAGLATGADKGIYFTGADVAAVFDLTAAGRELLNDVSVAAMRTTLGVPATGDLASYLPLAGGTLTGQLLVPAGSAAAPSIARDSAPSTGLFIQAASLGISIGGVRRGYLAGDYWNLERDGDGGFLMGSNGDILFGREGGGDLLIYKATALTNTTAPFYFRHWSSGTPAAGYGLSLKIQGKSSTTPEQDMARIAALWNVATHASRAADLVAYSYDHAAEREIWRGRANGSAAAIGFLGATPVARPEVTGDHDGNTALMSLLAALESLGLITDSTA